MTGKPLTGRTVFFITATAFGIIIAVNITLAVKAVSTFPGLEVRNSYVASQSFDTSRTAQEALGWDADLSFADGILRLALTGRDGRPANAEIVSATLGRATHVGEDRVPAFGFDGSAFVAPADLGPGNWNLRLVAVAPDGTEFRQRIVLYVRG